MVFLQWYLHADLEASPLGYLQWYLHADLDCSGISLTGTI